MWKKRRWVGISTLRDRENRITLTRSRYVWFQYYQNFTERPSWSWSYGSWIYNYLCTSAYHQKLCDFEARSRRGVLYTTLWDTVWQWLAADLWFSPGTLVSSTNKTHRYDITEILLKIALNTVTLTITQNIDGYDINHVIHWLVWEWKVD